MDILVALVRLAKFQIMTAQSQEGGPSECVLAGFGDLCFQGPAESKHTAQPGLTRWPFIPCLVWILQEQFKKAIVYAEHNWFIHCTGRKKALVIMRLF